MATPTILFDLDGTITDSGEGIINSAAMTLERLGLPVPNRQIMRSFVGPPLHDTFIKFGVAPKDADKAVEIYRSRYHTIGKYENYPYPGIRELLEALKAQKCHLMIATSKPEKLSCDILEHFHLAQYFDRICGATLDRSRITKADVIAHLLAECPSCCNMLMIGDTAFDVTGAADHNIQTIGVSWGYGSVEEMQKAGAVAIAHTPDELYNLLCKHFKLNHT